jgi:hypothetical protein
MGVIRDMTTIATYTDERRAGGDDLVHLVGRQGPARR